MPQNTATLKTQIKDAELTSNVNYLQPTGFRITIDRTRYPNLEYFCQSVTHPGMATNTVPISVRRLEKVPMPGDMISFGTVDFQILLDENMSSYLEMYEWMQRNVNVGQVSANQRRTSIPTHSDITLSILSSHNNLVKTITYKDAIPTGLSGMTFQSASGDASYISFNATFDFSEFEIK